MVAPRSLLASSAFVVGLLAFGSLQSIGQTPAAKPAQNIRVEDFKAFEVGKGTGDARTRVGLLRDGKDRVLDIDTKKLSARNKEALSLSAKEFVYAITDKRFYMNQPDNAKGELKPIPLENTLEAQIATLDRHIVVPRATSKLSVDQADYIIYFGIEVDAALKDILEAQQPVPTIVRVNAARMLSVAAKSGAPAHYPMILGLLSNPNTEPAILNYAIKAAEGLIGAYNVLLNGTAKYAQHTIADAEMVKLVGALETIVRRTTPYGPAPKSTRPVAAPVPAKAPEKVDPKAAAPAPAGKNPPVPMGKIEADTVAVSPEQQAVIHYFRRAAIRALAQCRFSQFVDAKDGRAVRPLATLARIAIGDPRITTMPHSDEVSIAVQGLANVHDFKDVNTDVLFDCIAQGVTNFALRKPANSKDEKTIAWKYHASNIMQALQDWQKNPRSKQFESRMNSLVTVCSDKVLMPIVTAGVGQAPQLEPLQNWRDQKQLTELKLYFEAPEPPLVRGFKLPTE